MTLVWTPQSSKILTTIKHTKKLNSMNSWRQDLSTTSLPATLMPRPLTRTSPKDGHSRGVSKFPCPSQYFQSHVCKLSLPHLSTADPFPWWSPWYTLPQAWLINNYHKAIFIHWYHMSKPSQGLPHFTHSTTPQYTFFTAAPLPKLLPYTTSLLCTSHFAASHAALI